MLRGDGVRCGMVWFRASPFLLLTACGGFGLDSRESAAGRPNSDSVDDSRSDSAADVDSVSDADTDTDTDSDSDADTDADSDTDPGVATIAGLVHGDLLVSEVMQDPASVTDAKGEWFEVYNATGAAVDLQGLLVTDVDSDAFTVLSSLVVRADAFVVFARNGDSGTNGNLIADYAYTGMDLANSADELQLWSGSSLLDEVAWDGGPSFPNAAGVAMALDARRLDADLNDAGSSWCAARVRYGDGDLGSPGSSNGPC